MNTLPVLYRLINGEVTALFPQMPVNAYWTISDTLFMPGLITPQQYRASKPASEKEAEALRRRLQTVLLKPELDTSLRRMERFPRADAVPFTLRPEEQRH